MKLFLKITMTLALGMSVNMTPLCRAASPLDEDHLVPVKEALGLSIKYQELWRRKLLVTPGETARFVSLPGGLGLETSISVYKLVGKSSPVAGHYWVTVTQASKQLWNSIAPDADGLVDPQTILVERCDTPIDESTALVVHEVWLTMLSQTRPQRSSGGIMVDSTRELFSAVNASGAFLEAESSTAPKENVKTLVKLAALLMEYCESSELQREKITRNIREVASKLLDRTKSGFKNRKQGSKGVGP